MWAVNSGNPYISPPVFPYLSPGIAPCIRVLPSVRAWQGRGLRPFADSTVSMCGWSLSWARLIYSCLRLLPPLLCICLPLRHSCWTLHLTLSAPGLWAQPGTPGFPCSSNTLFSSPAPSGRRASHHLCWSVIYSHASALCPVMCALTVGV